MCAPIRLHCGIGLFNQIKNSMDTITRTRCLHPPLKTCFLCTLAIGLLLLPTATLHAAAALSGSAKKTTNQKITRQAGNKQSTRPQTAQKGQIVRLQADTKVQATTRTTKKTTQKQSVKAKPKAKVAQAAKKTRSAKTVQTARVRQTGRTGINTSGRATGNAPFLKKKASLDEQTCLAQTLQNQLGVEVLVQEDPAHSGGLFIAPPNTETGQDNAAKALDLLANLPLGTPIGTSITSPFGSRRDPINGRRAFHEGVDFKAKRGDKVQATGNGRVVSSGYSPDYGENIIVSHGNGYETVFAHLSKRLVQVGDSVTPGDTVGLAGNSGRSTGTHLHYEIRYQGAPINPMDYMRATGRQAWLSKK